MFLNLVETSIYLMGFKVVSYKSYPEKKNKCCYQCCLIWKESCYISFYHVEIGNRSKIVYIKRNKRVVRMVSYVSFFMWTSPCESYPVLRLLYTVQTTFLRVKGGLLKEWHCVWKWRENNADIRVDDMQVPITVTLDDSNGHLTGWPTPISDQR